jgi:hypothetical protein
MQVRAILAAASLTLALAAFAQTPQAPVPVLHQPAGAGQTGLVAPGRSPELEILATGDVIGYLEPCG